MTIDNIEILVNSNDNDIFSESIGYSPILKSNLNDGNYNKIKSSI